MEIKYVVEFVKLAEIGNFMSAAEDLFIAQSTLSKHIMSLENELGITLFDRTTRKVQLTEGGKIFLEYAKTFAQVNENCMGKINDYLKRTVSSFSLGSIPPMAQYNITDIVYNFKCNKKNMSIDIAIGDPLELSEKLKNGEVELAFLREFEENEHFDRIKYVEDCLVAVVPIANALSKLHTIDLKKLENEDLVVLKEGSLLFEQCKKMCKSAGFDMKILYSGHQLDNIADFVVKGKGIGLLMKGQTKFILNPRLKIIDIEPKFNSQINLCWRKGCKLSPAAKHFIKCMQTTINSLNHN